MTKSREELVAAHLSAWNATPAAERDRLIASVYSPDVSVNEPDATLTGHDGMAQAISALQTQLPGAMITRSGPIQSAQDLVTYSWDLGPSDGPRVVTGRDVLLISAGTIVGVYVLIDA